MYNYCKINVFQSKGLVSRYICMYIIRISVKMCDAITQEPVIITPWAEYVIATRNYNGSTQINTQRTTRVASGVINWESVLELSQETDVLRHIISSDK